MYNNSYLFLSYGRTIPSHWYHKRQPWFHSKPQLLIYLIWWLVKIISRRSRAGQTQQRQLSTRTQRLNISTDFHKKQLFMRPRPFTLQEQWWKHFELLRICARSPWWTGPSSVYGLTWLPLAATSPFSFVFIWVWLQCKILHLFQTSCISQNKQTFSSNRLLYKEKCQYGFRNDPLMSFQVKSSHSFQLHSQSISFVPCKAFYELLLSEEYLGNTPWEPSVAAWVEFMLYCSLILRFLFPFSVCHCLIRNNFIFHHEQQLSNSRNVH